MGKKETRAPAPAQHEGQPILYVDEAERIPQPQGFTKDIGIRCKAIHSIEIVGQRPSGFQ